MSIEGTFVITSFMFATIVSIFMKTPQEKSFLTLPVPSIYKIIEIVYVVIYRPKGTRSPLGGKASPP